MTCLMDDVREVLRSRDVKVPESWIPGFNDSMLLYADDTVCMGTDAATLQHLLHAIEEISAEYGLSLNQTK
eukprot:3984187-Prorocentrum_lima.AAC.1